MYGAYVVTVCKMLFLGLEFEKKVLTLQSFVCAHHACARESLIDGNNIKFIKP